MSVCVCVLSSRAHKRHKLKLETKATDNIVTP